jgi:hypothetical protein
VAEDADITYEDLAATMADDLKNAIGTEELDAYI